MEYQTYHVKNTHYYNIKHNLDTPMVQCIDQYGFVIVCNICHLFNEIILIFNIPFTGKVLLYGNMIMTEAEIKNELRKKKLDSL